MKRMKATEAAKGFGQLLDDAQSGPVTVEKNGRPVAVVYSYEESKNIEAMKTAELKRLVDEGLADIDAGRVKEMTPQVMDDIKARARQHYEESKK